MTLVAATGSVGLAQEYNWIGAGGNWSTATNWTNGLIPVSGPNTVVRMAPILTKNGTATSSNDVLSAFQLNSLRVGENSIFGGRFTVTKPSGSWNFAGSNPSIVSAGRYPVTIEQNISSTSPLLIQSLGLHPLTIDTASSRTLTPTGGLTIQGVQVGSYQSTIDIGAFQPSGNPQMTLNSGRLTRLNANSMVSPIVINGGSFGESARLYNSLIVNSDIVVDTRFLRTFANPGLVELGFSGRQLTVNGDRTLRVGGHTSFFWSAPPNLNIETDMTRVELRLEQLPRSNSLVVRGGSAVRTFVDQWSVQNPNAVWDIGSGSIALDSPTNSSAVVNSLIIGGRSEVYLQGSASLKPVNLLRQDRGVAILRRDTSSSGTFAPNAILEMVGGGQGPGSTEQSIVPWMMSSPNSGTVSLVTQRNGNLVGLTNQEFVGNLLAANPNSNVRLTAPVVLKETIEVNSLFLNPSSGNVIITGTGTVVVRSGTILSTSGFGLNEVNFDFRSREGVINGGNYARLTGSNGLTIINSADLTNATAINVTGPLTLWGILNVTEASQVPGTGPVTGGGIGARSSGSSTAGGLQFPEPARARFSRDIITKGGTFSLRGADYSGVISGPGAMDFSSATLSGVNTYSGPTLIRNFVDINDNQNFGTNRRVYAYGGLSRLRILSPTTVDRDIEYASQFRIENNVNATITGLLIPEMGSVGRILKQGSGVLTFRSSVIGDAQFIVENGSVNFDTDSPLMNVSTVNNPGGVISGTARLGDFIPQSGDRYTIIPGTDGTIGTFTFSSMQTRDMQVLKMDMAGNGVSDRFVVATSFDSRTPFLFRNIGGVQPGNVYELARFGSTPQSINEFTGTWQGSPQTQGTFFFDNPSNPKVLYYRLNPVPEPATMLALGAGALVLLRRRKQR